MLSYGADTSHRQKLFFSAYDVSLDRWLWRDVWLASRSTVSNEHRLLCKLLLYSISQSSDRDWLIKAAGVVHMNIPTMKVFTLSYTPRNMCLYMQARQV